MLTTIRVISQVLLHSFESDSNNHFLSMQITDLPPGRMPIETFVLEGSAKGFENVFQVIIMIGIRLSYCIILINLMWLPLCDSFPDFVEFSQPLAGK